jgi:(aminoalkyl)phosphonate N-acetyltransferase
MRIRAARGDDFEAVTRLLEELGRPRVTEATRADCRAIFEAQVIDPDCHHIVCEDDAGDVVGFCALQFRPRLNHPSFEAWVPDLIVDEHVRMRGVGRALLEETERRARERGCHALVLESGYRRAEAHHLYRQLQMRDFGKQFAKDLAEED